MRFLQSQLWFLGTHKLVQTVRFPIVWVFSAKVRWAKPSLALVCDPVRC